MGWDPSKKGLEAYGDVVGNTLLPGLYDPIKKKVGEFGKKPSKDNAQAQEGLEQAQHAYDGLSAPGLTQITPDKVGNTAVSFHGGDSQASWDPQARQAQMAQMAALQQLAANGGRSAASDANLAHIRAQTGAQAQGLRGAAMADAARRGGVTGNQSLLAQLAGNQAAANTGAMQGADLAGQMSNTALQAGQGAAGIGAGLQGQSNDIAQAKDIMSRYNSGQDLASQQFNSGQLFDANKFNSAQSMAAQQYNSGLPMKQFDANLAIAQGKAGGGQTAAGYWSKKYGEDQAANGAVLGGLFGLGAAGAKAAMSKGGEVPGPEVVKGDSLLNDIVPYKGPKGSQINLSGGEVVVPKSLRDAPDQEIAAFVKHPPQTSAPRGLKDKEAMLSALKHLKKKH